MCRAFFGQGEAGTYLYSVGSQATGSQDGFARGDTAGSDEGGGTDAFHGRYQAERCRLFTAVVPACFESFGNDGIYTGFFTLGGETRGRYHVCHLDAVVVEVFGPRLRISCGGEDNLYLFVDDNLHDLVDFGVHQGDIHAEGE